MTAESTPAARALPEAVRAYLERCLPDRAPAPRQVRLTQIGEMWQKPGGRALRFTASERFAVDRVAFSWRARFPVIGPIAMNVIDGYADGEARLEARMLGIRMMRQTGREIVVGEALRYLAELPWAPHAIAHNRTLEWRALDGGDVEVAIAAGAGRVAARVEFDAAGDIARASSEARPYRADGVWRPTPWAGDFGAYGVVSGIRLPTRAEVYWDLPEGRFVYWRGRVTSVEALAEPFTGV